MLFQQIPDALPVDQCAELVEFSERCGFLTQRFGVSHPAEIRYRVAIDDSSIAKALWKQLAAKLLPLTEYFEHSLLTKERAGVQKLKMIGLNERLRFYKYHAGERFSPHFDLSYEKSPHEQSRMSVIVYLNDGFEGGETAFDGEGAQPPNGIGDLVRAPIDSRRHAGSAEQKESVADGHHVRAGCGSVAQLCHRIRFSRSANGQR